MIETIDGAQNENKGGSGNKRKKKFHLNYPDGINENDVDAMLKKFEIDAPSGHEAPVKKNKTPTKTTTKPPK